MISLHIVVDNAPPEVLDRALLYLKRTGQRAVNIAAGAQLDRGMQFVERVRAELPDITILWRNLDPEDTGIFSKYGALWGYDHKVDPYLDWFQKNQVVFVPDNESSGDDDHMRRYVRETVKMAKLLHQHNLRGAFCRFATGNIVESQYPLLKPIFDVMLPGDFISPNEYSAQPGYPGGSGGHLQRYKLMWDVAGYPLPTIIGEAGIAMNYDPGKGYIDAGMSDEAYAQQMIDEEVWYAGGAITRCLYLVGGYTHEGYRVREGVLEYLETHYERHRPPPIIVPPPPPPPEPAPEGEAIAISPGFRLRFSPDASDTSNMVGATNKPSVVTAKREGEWYGFTVYVHESGVKKA